MNPPVLHSARLTLRPTEMGDAAAIQDLFADEETTRYWAHRPLRDLAAGEAWIATRLEARAAGTLLDWIAFDGEVLVGIAFLSALSLENLRGEVGYAVHRDRQGSGYATEMLECVLTHAIETLGLHRIEADVDPRNAPSMRLLERQGFVEEGRLRDRWRVTGEVQDTALLGLLAPEWTPRAQSRRQ